MFVSQSTFTVQNEVDKIRSFAEIEPIFNVPGFTNEPALTIANDVITAICATTFPHKWNETKLPQFYTNSFQQDYALVRLDGSSVTDVEWLQRGVAFDINNGAIPKPYVPVECGRSLQQRTGTFSNSGTITGDGFLACSYYNYDLYYGQWGAANTGNRTLGNNPVAGSVYTAPLGNLSQPANPITQIKDANDNFLVLTTYGTEGTTAPTAPANATPGTTVSGLGATTIWTVVDPFGMGIRILDVPSQTGVVWQFNITGQKKPPVFTSLSSTLFPLQDKYEPFFRAGMVAQAYRYSPEAKIRAKFQDQWNIWLKSLKDMNEAQDRELEEYRFIPERGIMGSGRQKSTFQGAAWPFNYPRT